MTRTSEPPTGSIREVFLAFLRLGCTSFGGPIAHLGYFQNEFVERRKWLTEEAFAEVVALAQSMPGPASSQVGFALGLLRASWAGGLAAWVGFTTPSAILMLAFAFAHKSLSGKIGLAVVHGLQLVAVAVVAQAIVAMQRSLAPDRQRMALALIATAIVLFGPAALGTVLAIAVGALVGWFLLRAGAVESVQIIRLGISRAAGSVAAAMFFTLLVVPPLLARITGFRILSVFDAFYRTGALVFGGGHVVLPLLENAVVAKGWVDQQAFLSGYGAAQAIPGPLFTFAAYLGAAIRPSAHPLLLGVLALVSIFLPGLLIMIAVLPFWKALREKRQIQASLRGVNASVVGVLIAAFFEPVWTSAVHTRVDFFIALVAFALLTLWKLPSWIIVLGVAFSSCVIAVLTA
jgi:chromate transporter